MIKSRSPAGLSAKKGLGSCSEATTPAELGRLRLGWYYNWRTFPIIASVPGVEFVPMFWGPMNVTPKNLDAVRKSGATHVLGFNEPDMINQSNLTPGECLELWPRLMSLDQRLGSPAPATAAWLDEFIPEAKRRGLRVDFVCLHMYPDISHPDAADWVAEMVEEAYKKFGLPVWLTECGAADVAVWNHPRVCKPTPEMARSFLKKLIGLLERLPFVERYAWFADRVADEYALGTIFHLHSSRLTPLGKIYRDES